MSEPNSTSSSTFIRMLLKSFNCPLCKKSFKNLVKIHETISKCPNCSYAECPEINKKDVPTSTTQNNNNNSENHSIKCEFIENNNREIDRDIQDNIVDSIEDAFISNLLGLEAESFVIINRMPFQEEENEKVNVAQSIIDKLNHFKMDKGQCKKNEKGEQEFPKCTICLMEITEGMDSILLPCNHIFHDNCLTHWFKNHNTCPLCRFELTSKQFKNGYGANYINDTNQNHTTETVFEDVE